MKPLRRLRITLPEWPEFRDDFSSRLEVEAGEIAEFASVPTVVTAPDAVLLDLTAWAERVEWPLGQLVSYLMLQGIIKLAAEARG